VRTEPDEQESIHSAAEDATHLFKMSAAGSSSLQALSGAIADYMEIHKPMLRDLSHTLLARWLSLRKMFFLTASNNDELIAKLRAGPPREWTKSSKPQQKVALIFTGQGAQWQVFSSFCSWSAC
jgi:acyl transferase domain-containing protein